MNYIARMDINRGKNTRKTATVESSNTSSTWIYSTRLPNYRARPIGRRVRFVSLSGCLAALHNQSRNYIPFFYMVLSGEGAGGARASLLVCHFDSVLLRLSFSLPLSAFSSRERHLYFIEECRNNRDDTKNDDARRKLFLFLVS